MRYPPQAVHVAMAQVQDACCPSLVEAMRNEGWNVELVTELNELLALAESGRHDMAILACDRPAGLPRMPVRRLMGLQTDLAVVFLAGDRGPTTDCPALAGSTSEQVLDLHASTKELMDLLRGEARSVISAWEEYVVMCVDDDEDFLTSLESFLPRRLSESFPRSDLDFEFYSDPLEALSAAEQIRTGRLAVVIADQVMPAMDGVELLSRVGTFWPRAKRVLLTGHAGLESAVEAINRQVLDRYFFKPIEDPAGFAGNIRELLRQYALRLRAEAQQERLMAQLEYIRAISAAPSVERALALTVQFLDEEVSPRSIVLLSAEDGGLIVRAGMNLPADLEVGKAAPAGDGLCRWVLQWRRFILAARAEDLPCQAAEAFLCFPLMAAPLAWGSARLGVVLTIGRRSDEALSRDDRMLMSFVADAASVALGALKDREAIERHYVETMSSLMETVEAKDGYTSGHTERVTEMAVALAEAAGMTGDRLDDVRHAACLHDIGKIAVPDSIICKRAGLNPKELAVMREHPARGDRIVQHLKFLGSARMIIRSHHERYDGKGYPDGLKAEEIPLGARILAVADSYDAMTSARPYRNAMAPPEALAEIVDQAGKQFDPKLVSAFLEITKDVVRPRSTPAGKAVALASKR